MTKVREIRKIDERGREWRKCEERVGEDDLNMLTFLLTSHFKIWFVIRDNLNSDVTMNNFKII